VSALGARNFQSFADGPNRSFFDFAMARDAGDLVKAGCAKCYARHLRDTKRNPGGAEGVPIPQVSWRVEHRSTGETILGCATLSRLVFVRVGILRFGFRYLI